jgi:tetratricopeptide (TPR) repeat protein
MTRKSRNTVVAALSLAVAFSFHALASTPVSLECSVSAPRVLLGEPLSANIVLRAPGLKDSAVLVTSRRFLAVSLTGPQGPCKELFQVDEMRKQPWSPWLDAVTLSSEIPNWEESLDLLLHYGLTSPGAYTLTIHWGSAPLDDFAATQLRKRLDQQFQGRALVFQDKLSLNAELHFVIERPTGIDHEAFVSLKGCPTCDPAKLLKDFPASTYAAYVVWEKYKPWVPGMMQQETAVSGEAARAYAERIVNPKKDPSVKDYRTSPDLAQGQIKQAEAILQVHPDFPFRSGLYYFLGIENLELGQFPQAVMAFTKCLNEDPTPKMCETAKIYLEVLNKYGWK